VPALAKICGLKTPETIAAAVAGGAGYVGFVFYPKSPRAVTPEEAAALGAAIPEEIAKVGLFVDEDPASVAHIARLANLDMIQFHGQEPPEVIAFLRRMLLKTVVKAIKVATPDDLALARPYDEIVDWLLFDAKADAAGDLPGGNGRPFDWSILRNARFDAPWMLSGGLNPENVAAAIAASGAIAVDVSSGVEDAPGVKNPDKIRAFLAAASS